MSVCRPARCLFRRSLSHRKPPSAHHLQPFHSTSISQARRRPHYPSISQAELTKIEEKTTTFPEYTEEEWKALKHHYTPEQLAALEEAEKAIDLRDLVTQGQFRTDPWKPDYLDDFTTLDPFLDKKVVKEPEYAAKLRFMSEREQEDQFSWRRDYNDFDPRSTDELFRIAEDREMPEHEKKFFNDLKVYRGNIQKEPIVRRLLQKYVPGVNRVVNPDWLGIERPADINSLGSLTPSIIHGDGIEQGMDDDYSALAPEIPKFEDPRIRWPFGEDDNPNAAGLKRLALQTGFTTDQIKVFRVKNLVTHRVVNQTRMGKIASMYNLTIAGNGDGLLGIGEGKSAEPEDSRRQAMLNAIRNMKPIHRYENRTVYGDVFGKVGAAQVELSARPPGFGLRCHHLIFEICRCAGIWDLAARSTRSRNPMNNVKATFEALTSQRLPEDIARARGRKLVDVRKVYYAGKGF